MATLADSYFDDEKQSIYIKPIKKYDEYLNYEGLSKLKSENEQINLV